MQTRMEWVDALEKWMDSGLAKLQANFSAMQLQSTAIEKFMYAMLKIRAPRHHLLHRILLGSWQFTHLGNSVARHRTPVSWGTAHFWPSWPAGLDSPHRTILFDAPNLRFEMGGVSNHRHERRRPLLGVVDVALYWVQWMWHFLTISWSQFTVELSLRFEDETTVNKFEGIGITRSWFSRVRRVHQGSCCTTTQPI